MYDHERKLAHDVIDTFREPKPRRNNRRDPSELREDTVAVLQLLKPFGIVIVGGTARDGYVDNDLDIVCRKHEMNRLLEVLGSAGSVRPPTPEKGCYTAVVGKLSIDITPREDSDDTWKCARCLDLYGVIVKACPYHHVVVVKDQTIITRGNEKIRPASDKPKDKTTTCIHLGPVIRVANASVCGHPRVDVHACTVHGECTTTLPCAKTKRCIGCLESDAMRFIQPDESCVLVGNGPSATAHKLGETIDSFDHVIRFNRFKTLDYEQYVGTKTTLWCTFGRGMLPQDDVRPSRVLYVHEKAEAPYHPAESWRIPQWFYQEMRQQVNAESTWDDKARLIPSSGLVVIEWLLRNGVKKLHLVGFDHFGKEQSGQHHYWIRQSFTKPKEHDGDAESRIIARHGHKIEYLTPEAAHVHET